MTRTLLMISYHYAPSPAVGAKRFSFLAREFTRLGYDVHVITNAQRESNLGAADSTLPLAGQVHRCVTPVEVPLPGGGFLRRAANSVLRRALEPVSLEYFWARAATRTALDRFAGRDSQGVVIATSPPYASLIAGSRIARELGWPLIIDYRDPWSAHTWPRWRRGAFANRVSRRVERPIVGASAARILNTPAMRDSFEKHFPEAPAARNYVIPNGFDPQGPPPPLANAGAVNIVHAGEIYTGRSLVPVLQAAQRLHARHPDRPVRVTTYGELPGIEVERIRAAGLTHLVDVRPRIPFTRLFADLQSAHALLAIVGDHMLYSTPYKVYDYMAAGRPILGLAPRGASLFGLLSESGAGTCLEPTDVDGIESALEKMIFNPPTDTRARVERFRWSNLALQYRMAIEAVAGGIGTPTESEPLRRVAGR